MRPKRKIITCGAILSRKLAGLSDADERLYWRLYMATDNFGTMTADPWNVAGTCMPNVKGWAGDKKAAKAIAALTKAGLLHVWEVDGKPWLHIIEHDKHQSKDWIAKRGTRKTPKPNDCPCCGHLQDPPQRSRWNAGKTPKVETVSDTDATAGPLNNVQPTTPYGKGVDDRVRTQASADTIREYSAKAAGVRYKLGGLALVVDELVGIYNDRDIRWHYHRLWEPCVALKLEYGEAILSSALAAARDEIPNDPGVWLPVVCANKRENADRRRAAKTSASTIERRVESAFSDADRAALDRDDLEAMGGVDDAA